MKRQAVLRKLISCSKPTSPESSSEELAHACHENVNGWAEALLGVESVAGALRPHPVRTRHERLKSHIASYARYHGHAAAIVSIEAELARLRAELEPPLGPEAAAPLPAPLPLPVPLLPDPAPPLALPEAPVDLGPGGAAPIVEAENAITELRHAIRERLTGYYPDGFLDRYPKWNPDNWKKDDRDGHLLQDLQDIDGSITRMEEAGDRDLPDGLDAWPELRNTSQVKPGCGNYKTQNDCIWPCAWKFGDTHRTDRICRPARLSY